MRGKNVNGCNIIPWSSLPKWVYNQRLSDEEKDLPFWYRDTDGINNFEICIRPLEADPHDREEREYYGEGDGEGNIVIWGYSKKELLDKLRRYKETFELEE